MFVPLAGDTVSQGVALLLAVHDVFEVTVTLVLAAAVPGLHAEDDRVSAGAEDDAILAYLCVLPITVVEPLPVSGVALGAAAVFT